MAEQPEDTLDQEEGRNIPRFSDREDDHAADVAYADAMQRLGPMCTGPVCVNCCKCRDCGRTVGTRHLDGCACTPETLHDWCVDCWAPRVADILGGRRYA